jgi:hypothetical protein
MGFVVLPALVADISAVYDVYFAAFKHNTLTRALFPSATTEDLIDSESEFRYVRHHNRLVPPCNALYPHRHSGSASLIITS